jgi:catechol 2,3-dioxygenase-like lactoylglutathione lyase family enzyme
MAVVPHTIDIVVADMAVSLRFYRTLGLPVPEGQDDEVQVQVATPGGATLGFLAEAMMKQAYPDWIQPIGQRVTFACRCDSAAELDATFERVVAAGFKARKAPWDAFWGQRYAMLEDPDGNRVDLFAALTESGEE